ncbi:MAG: type II secretion system minor pseudopilin GspH [Pseudomonadales bacterium]
MKSLPTTRIQRGFTLVEILVVIIIIGFLASIAVLSSGGDPLRKLRSEAQRTLTIIQMAGDEALLQGSEYGLKLNQDSYQIVNFDESKSRWQADDNSAFRTYRLPESMTLSLASEGNNVSLEKIQRVDDSGDDKDTPDDPLKPTLLILSSGEMTPFEIHFQSTATPSSILLSSDGLDDISLQTQHE